MLWFTLGAIAALGIILLASRLSVGVIAVYNSEVQYVSFTLKFFHMTFYKRSISLDQVDQSEPVNPRKRLFNDLRLLRNMAGEIVKRIRCERFVWRTDIGLSEADLTAIAAGGLWSVKSTFIASFINHMHVRKRPEIIITPYFKTAHFSSHLDSSFSMTIGQMLYTIYTLFKNMP